MDGRVVVSEEPEDSERRRRLDQFERNGVWLSEHGASVYDQHAGRYVAVAAGEVFAADDAWEARRLALERHPDDEPFIQYIPRERYARVYAG
jgi:hypothetical protein